MVIPAAVFRVSEDVDFANATLRAKWDELPEFVYGHIKGRVVPQHWGAFEERLRPIIYFHAGEPIQLRVQVDFPCGMAGVWFPATVSPAVLGNQKQPKIGNTLRWQIGVKQCPNGWQPKNGAPPPVPANHWIARVREVKADDIFARYGPNNVEVEREKFIYYDGLFPQGKWMKINVEKDRVSLTSQVKHPVFDITVVDRRHDKVRVGRVAKLAAGELVKQLDAPKFAERDAAMKKLLAIGPAALVQVQRLRERKDLSVEVRERLDRLVRRWNAKEAFDR